MKFIYRLSHLTSVLAASLLTFAFCLNASGAIIGFSFSNSDLVPEILDTNLTVSNQATTNAATFPTAGTILYTKSAGNVMEFRFDVEISPGFEMSITELFVGQEQQWRPVGQTSELLYDTGSGFQSIPSTQHTPGNNSAVNFTSAPLTLSGLTGTVSFKYSNGPRIDKADNISYDEFNLAGTVTAIPESSSLLLIGMGGLAGLIFLHRRK